MRVIFMGSPDFAVPTLDALATAGHDVVAARVGADRARILGIEIAAGRTGREVGGDRLQRGEQRLQRPLALLHQMQHRAPRRARAEAGEPRQRLGQSLDFAACHKRQT